jgi:transposase
MILHRRLLAIVRDDEVCRRLMTIPGVGPVVALTYRATVDVPARFRKSKAVGAVFGLTCSKYQSGEIDRTGRISRCGDEMMRVMLYEAARGSRPGRQNYDSRSATSVMYFSYSARSTRARSFAGNEV